MNLRPNFRPKTKRRLLILLTVGVGAISVAGVLVVIQLRRYEKHRLAYRAVAMNAYQHADYRTAIADFPKYLGNDRMDAEAIFDYAVARSKLPTADLSYLTEAKKLFDRYLELSPDDVNAQHQMLDIYQKLHYGGESSALTDILLQKNPDDIPALSARLGEYLRDQRNDLALPVALRLDDLTPLDVKTQTTTFELMASLRKPPGELIDRANQLIKAHPQDPRFELLRAVAARATGDLDGTRQWLRTAASRPSPDADFTLTLAGALDRMNLWTDSRELLEKNASSADAAPQLKAGLVQRLWESNEYDRALKVLSGLSPADPASDSNLIGLHALLLFCKDHSPSSDLFKKDLTALQQRSDDMAAIGWASLLKAITDDAPADVLDPARMCQDAVRSDPTNPDVRFYLALEYLRLGESELALQCLWQTTQMQPEWDTPYELMARTLMQRQQTTEAIQHAQAACERNPQSVTNQITFALVSYQRLHPGAGAADVRPVLSYIEQLRKIDPNHSQLLAADVDLLARCDQKQNAIDTATASLTTQVAESPTTLKQLADVDRLNHLGLAKQIADRLAKCQPTTPQQALDQVQADLVTGYPDVAKTLLSAIKQHPNLSWQITWLQARESIGDPGVAGDWRIFSDSFPNDLRVQQAAIQSPVVNANRPLMDRTIDRLKTLTGDGAIQWKLARARWELDSPENTTNHANSAAASMAEIARIAPHYAPPQVIWADALVKAGDVNGAIEHLTIAAQIEPENIDISVKLAGLLAQQGQMRELTSQLNDLQNNPWLNNSQRLEIARLYRQIGDRSGAIKLLDENHKIHSDDPARDILLAQLYAENGSDTDAVTIYSNWMSKTNVACEVVQAKAWFDASRGRIEQARQSLATLTIPDDEKSLIEAKFEAQWGNKQLSITDFQNSVRVAPGNVHAWIAWSGTDLRNRDFTGAFNAANEGSKQIPADPTLSALKNRAQTLAGLSLDADTQSVLDALAIDPQSEAGIATVAALAGSEDGKDASDRLHETADKYPRFLPVQITVIDRDCRAGLYDQAADRATRLCQIFPIDPEPARWLTMVDSTIGQWERALAAAQDWRSRSLDHPHPADIAIATAQIALNHPQQAAEQILWYPENPSSADKDKALELYVRAVSMQNQTEDAWNIIQPYIATSVAWRKRWLQIIADTATDLEIATGQIHQIEKLVSPNSLEDQIAIGECWFTIATRFNHTTCLQNAKSIAEALTDAGGAPAEAWLLLGNIQQQENELPAAEISFTNAVKISPETPQAKNNLAMVMLLRHEDLNAARQLATSAVSLAPVSSALHSTLGEIDLQMNDLLSARQQFQSAIGLNPDNAEALIGLASVQNKSGEITNVAATVQQVDTVLQSNHSSLPAPVQAELDRLRIATRKPTSAAGS